MSRPRANCEGPAPVEIICQADATIVHAGKVRWSVPLDKTAKVRRSVAGQCCGDFDRALVAEVHPRIIKAATNYRAIFTQGATS
jgi:hypothetical protein